MGVPLPSIGELIMENKRLSMIGDGLCLFLSALSCSYTCSSLSPFLLTFPHVRHLPRQSRSGTRPARWRQSQGTRQRQEEKDQERGAISHGNTARCLSAPSLRQPRAPSLSLYLAQSLALPSRHNLVTEPSLSSQPVIGPTLVARNVDNGGTARESARLGEGQGASTDALEQRLQVIEDGIASIKAALTGHFEASSRMPGNPHPGSHSPSGSPVTASAGLPFEPGARKVTSHSRQSLCLRLLCPQW